MPYLNDKFNVGPQILWDRLQVANAAVVGTETRMFVTPIGGAKTKLDTNMVLVSQLPEPQVYKAIGIQMRFNGDLNRADREALVDGSYWEFWVGDRIYGEGHIEDAPGGSQTTGFDVANNANVMTNGQPAFNEFYPFSMPQMVIGQAPNSANVSGYEGLDINRSERFYFKLLRNSGYTITSAAGLILTVNIVGYIARQVQ